MVEKPTTMVMDEFKDKFVELLNSTPLPAWVMIYILEPYMNQLRQLDELNRAEDKERYQKAIEEEEKTEEQ